MFELLTRVLIWVLIVSLLWYIFSRFINKTYLTWLGGLLLLTFIILAFFNPTDGTIGTIWNVLSLPLRPLGLAIFLLLSALRGGTKLVDGRQVVAALLVLFFASTPVVAYWLTGQSERAAYSTVATQGDRPLDPNAVRALVVLGDGDPNRESTYGIRTQFSNTEDQFGTGLMSRLYYASRLYREQAAQNNTPLVIVSAGPQLNTDPQQANNAQAITNVLTTSGVPQDRIIIEPNAIDARTSATEVERLLVERGFLKDRDSVVLIAPALAVRRASSAFALTGLRVVSRPTDFFAFQTNQSRPLAILSDLIPNEEALALTTRVVNEYLTSIYYFLRGWLYNPLAMISMIARY
jgi:uncharacterized SAM-binding protein YcdF (DUF218 family)